MEEGKERPTFWGGDQFVRYLSQALKKPYKGVGIGGSEGRGTKGGKPGNQRKAGAKLSGKARRETVGRGST